MVKWNMITIFNNHFANINIFYMGENKMTGTFLNFFKCNLTNDNIEVMKTDYIDEENFK